MKTTLLTLAMTASFWAAEPVFAGNPQVAAAVETQLNVVDESLALVAFTNPLGARIKIEIVSSEGYLMYRKTWKHRLEYTAHYQLSDLFPGHYTLRLYADGQLVKTTDIEIKTRPNA
ncbi:hypothetical protein GC167_05895 [bacterium]|nr:hypothetical protein [bacterium]